MATLSVLWRHALWMTAPLVFVSVGMLIVCIVGVVRLVKRSHILSVPVVEEQTVEFFGSGPVVLCMEGPRFTTKFAWLKYRLVGADGEEVPGRRAWFRARTSGVSKVRMELRVYTIPKPGQYVLYVDGLKAEEQARGEEDTRHHLVFMRPHLAKSVGYVIGITLSAGTFFGSLVLSLLRLLERPAAETAGGGTNVLGIILTVTIIVNVIILALVLAYFSGRSHRKTLDKTAETAGWHVEATDTLGLREKLEAIFPDKQFTDGRTITVERGSRNIFALDANYSTRNSRQNIRPVTACLVESSRFPVLQSRVEIVARTWLDAKLLADQVDMGNSEFSQNFIVLSKDPNSVWRLVNRRMQDVFLDHMKRPLYNPVEVTMETGRAAILTGAIAQPERWRDLVELAQRLESVVE